MAASSDERLAVLEESRDRNDAAIISLDNKIVTINNQLHSNHEQIKDLCNKLEIRINILVKDMEILSTTVDMELRSIINSISKIKDNLSKIEENTNNFKSHLDETNKSKVILSRILKWSSVVLFGVLVKVIITTPAEKIGKFIKFIISELTSLK